jgi:5-methylcytosine-specific restriction endonuclease McrA
VKARTLADILPGTLVDAQQQKRPTTKPRPQVLDRIAYKRERTSKESKFLTAVWKRDESQCRICGRKMTRSIKSPVRGHVHHIRGRNVAPEDRFNPKAALLLCAICHAKIHAGQATRTSVSVSKKGVR